LGHHAGVNRTDRLYAMVEQLRAVAPRPRTAQQLADRFEVSVRTIERDLLALQESGVPIWAQPGPGGGYALDPSMTLPPVNFTAVEAAAMAIALGRVGQMPFASAARSALQKVVHAMSSPAAEGARSLADRVAFIRPRVEELATVDRTLEQAVLEREVVVLDYEDRAGEPTRREVEPVGFVASDSHWYLVAWCRLRQDGRSFRTDRIHGVRPTGEVAEERPFESTSGYLEGLLRKAPLIE
jgi:predicted DNA-binding transcriptional regulator YafY